MKSPKGHFLDCLIETTKLFENKLKIIWIINKYFSKKKTYIPNNIKIYKSVKGNHYNRKENKFLYILEKIFLFFENIYHLFYFAFYFYNQKNFINYLKALKSNRFTIPKYFKTFYKKYLKLKLCNNDHIFFQSARRNDVALINFLIKLNPNHPKFHMRVFLPPKIKFNSFFYYLKEIKTELVNKKVFLYLFGNDTYKYFIKNCRFKNGVFKSLLPWSFYKRNFKKKNFTIGYVGNARRSRGFHLLPKIILELERRSNSFKYLIQFSNISADLVDTKNKLYEMSKINNRIKIIEEYSDYKKFRNILKKIDIMPIIHKAEELNKITSGTMYSCLTHEIPMIIPKKTYFLKNILKHKSYEEISVNNDFTNLIIKVANNYSNYLKNAKLNSSFLKQKLRKDPLNINIY
jgi:hypothetical protein